MALLYVIPPTMKSSIISTQVRHILRDGNLPANDSNSEPICLADCHSSLSTLVPSKGTCLHRSDLAQLCIWRAPDIAVEGCGSLVHLALKDRTDGDEISSHASSQAWTAAPLRNLKCRSLQPIKNPNPPMTLKRQHPVTRSPNPQLSNYFSIYWLRH